MNKLQLTFNALAFILIFTVAPAFSQNNSAGEIQVGYELLKTENFDSAVLAFSNILRAEADNVQARLGLAIALIGIDKYQEASREIAKLLARTPKDPKLLEMAARSFWRQRRFTEAENVLKRRLELGNTPGELWALYGDVLEARKKTIDAVFAYEKAVSLNPDSLNLRYALGSLYWKRIRYDDAEREFLEILRLRPNEPRASFNLGDIYLSKGEAAKSIPYLETAWKSFSGEYDTQFALGRAYLATNNYEKAIAHLDSAVKLRPEIAEGFYQLAIALQKSGRLNEAKLAFETTQRLQKARRDSETVPTSKKDNR